MQGAKQCVMANWHMVHPTLRNLMILFVPQRKMLGLETVQQGQDTVNKCRTVVSRPVQEHGFPREALPALQLAFASLTGLLLNPSAHSCQILSDPSFAWSAR